MKSKLRIFLSILFILCAETAATQGINKTESLDLLLRNIKNPNEKVDLIIAFLEKPENHYADNAIDIANRAYQIAEQNNYALGKVRVMLKLSTFYFRIGDYIKAMEYAQKSKEISEDLNFEIEFANSLGLIGTIYNELGDFDNSAQYLYRSLSIFEKLDDKEGKLRSISNIGIGFYYQKDYIKALEYFNNSLSIAKSINNQALVKKQYNNMAAVFTDLQQYDTAIALFKNALAISVNIHDKFGQGINIMNIGNCQMNQAKYSDAISSFQQSLDIFTELNNHLHMAKCYLNFGFCYFSTNRIEESIDYFKKALQEGQNQGYYQIINSAAKTLDQIYTQKKDTISAYKYISLAKLAGDSLSLLQNKKELFKQEFQFKQEQIAKEQNIRQMKNYFILGFIILALLFILTITVLFYSRQKIRTKNAILEKEKAESEIRFKNKELSINLMSLLKKNELIAEISRKVAELENPTSKIDLKEAARRLNHDIKYKTDERLWEEFSLRFKEINSEFYDKLLKKYPDLSQSELKLCAYLRLNMTTKEISDITGQRTETLEKARYRMRKKFGLTNSESNLVTFLTQI